MTNDQHLSLTGKQWVLPEPTSAKAVSHPSIPLAPWIYQLLHQRGLHHESQIESYLNTSLQKLEDPLLMADMPQAVERLSQAITEKHSIVIYGDYDVDGVCSTTILVEFLRTAGANVDYYIPDRQSEGYGVNEDAIREIASRAQVLVTTDCGITAVEPLTVANQLGLDVIVVDHHQVPDELPPAVAILDPHRPNCNFPFKELCATGVAFMLIAALRRHLRESGAFTDSKEPDIRIHLDAVALATVADMVPIQGTNRILVAAGLRVLAQAKRPGLAALMKISKIVPEQISASDLGYRIGPRINARGRLDHAGAGVELLLTQDTTQAAELARVLDEANLARREIEKDTVAQAIERVEKEQLNESASMVVYDPTWHPGVLGLVASRLTQRFCRPTVVIGKGGKGSARSIEGVNIHAAMATAQEFAVRFGGHHAAAGLTIEPEQIPNFHHALNQAVVKQKGNPPFIAVLRPDMEIHTKNLHLGMVSQLERLAPFGQKNPEPLFVATGLPVRAKRIVGQRHLKLFLGQEGEEGHDAIAFGFGEHLNALGNCVDAVFRIERNIYRGKESLQLKIEDLRPSQELN